MDRRAFLARSVGLGAIGVGIAADAVIPKLSAVVPAKEYVWSGGVTPTSGRVNVFVPHEGKVELLVGERKLLAQTPLPNEFRSVTFEATELKPSTVYPYRVILDGVPSETLSGSFRTFPEGPASFDVAFASCAKTGSTSAVFDAIRANNPALFIHMGDFHYENISKPDEAKRRAAMAKVHSSPQQTALYRSVPVAYIWDDHDYLGNGSGGESVAGKEARKVYQTCVPHYPLPLGDGDHPISQAFSLGRVRFVLTDLRSSRKGTSMLGPDQLAWFKKEMKSAHAAHGLIVWMSSIPWIGKKESKTTDHWGAYAEERTEIADYLKAEGIRNVCIISGDAHMLAIDDGTNSDYATDGGLPIPVFQAASLDQSPSTKGGPYSEGKFPGRGQFGLMHVTDDGKKIAVTWTGLNERNERVVGYRFGVGSHQ